MLEEIAGTVYLLLPLLGGAIAHAACMKFGWFGALARPIDAGRAFRGKPIFGHSKTWRGPLAVAAGTAAVLALQRHLLHPIPAFASLELVDYAALPGGWFGLLAGAAAELSELPNSFTKRRLGVEPGGTAGGLRGLVFYLWDQLDLLLGYWLVFAIAVEPTALRVGISILVVGGVHPLLTLVGYLLGVRPTAR